MGIKWDNIRLLSDPFTGDICIGRGKPLEGTDSMVEITDCSGPITMQAISAVANYMIDSGKTAFESPGKYRLDLKKLCDEEASGHVSLDALLDDLSRVTAERDAAVEELESLMLATHSAVACRMCAYDHDHVHCGGENFTRCTPKWRGLRKENGRNEEVN